MIKKILLIQFTLFATVDCANADNATWYINLNSGIGEFTQFPLKSGFAWSLNGGYQFNNYLALEGGYTGMYTSQYNGSVTLGNNLFDVAVKGILPFSDFFRLYGKLGGGYLVNGASGNLNVITNNSSIFSNGKSNSSTSGLMGGGVSFSINKSFDVNFEDNYIMPLNNQVGSINMLSLGLTYKFSSSADTKPTINKSTGIDDIYSYTSRPLQTESKSNIDTSRPLQTESKSNIDTSRPLQTESKPNIVRDNCIIVMVQKYNTLWSISQQTSVSIDRLKSLNGIIGDKIKVGDKIKIGACN